MDSIHMAPNSVLSRPFLLIITSGTDEHVSHAEGILKSRNANYFRFNVEDFPTKVSIGLTIDSGGHVSGVLRGPDVELSLEDITHAWYRKPHTPEVSSEINDSALNNFALQESETLLWWLYHGQLDIRWLNHPWANLRAKSKVLQMQVAASVGLAVPATALGNDDGTLLEFLRHEDLAIKALGSYWLSNTQFPCYTKRVTQKEVLGKALLFQYAPSFIQEYIPKAIELRVTIIDKRVYSCAIDSQVYPETADDWRHPKYVRELAHSKYKLPDETAKKCIDILRILGLTFGAFDLILTPGGEYVFIEVNPNGQWLWLERLSGLQITDGIVDWFLDNLGERA